MMEYSIGVEKARKVDNSMKKKKYNINTMFYLNPSFNENRFYFQ